MYQVVYFVSVQAEKFKKEDKFINKVDSLN